MRTDHTLNAAKAAAEAGRLAILIDERQSTRLAHVPTSQRLTFLRAWRGEKSLARAIRAKCLDCCCYQRIEVQSCTATACPLWRYRPFRPALEVENDGTGEQEAAEIDPQGPENA